MREQQNRSAIDIVVRRLHEELEAQLTFLSARHQEELDQVRLAAELDAEARWTARVDALRSEWSARLEAAVASARAEAERQMAAEAQRMRVAAEQSAAESAVRLRQELADRLASEREHLSNRCDQLRHELDESRRHVEALRQETDGLIAARERAETALESERRARADVTKRHDQSMTAAAAAQLTERQAQLAVVERLLVSVRAMDAARTLSGVLTTLLASAAAEAARAALFVIHGSEYRGWKAAGFDSDITALRFDVQDDGLLGDVLRRGEPAVTAGGAEPSAPAFAELPPGRAAIAVPLLVGGHPVALLYADDGVSGQREVPASWPEAIQVLGRHAAVNLAHLTAGRAAAVRRSLTLPASAPPARREADQAAVDGAGARRYARLLVSEIKLCNEAAVQIGRQKRDLLERLKPEIDRARRLYERRISSSVDSQAALFQQELVHTLAGGDPALLGDTA